MELLIALDIRHGLKLGSVGVIKSPLPLAQEFFRLPETTHFPTVPVTIANPEAAIANGIDGGSHWGFHQATSEFDHGTGVFRMLLTSQRARRRAVKLITVEHSEINDRALNQSQLALMAL